MTLLDVTSLVDFTRHCHGPLTTRFPNKRGHIQKGSHQPTTDDTIFFESPTSTPALTTGGFRSATGSWKKRRKSCANIHSASYSFPVVFNSCHGFGHGCPNNNPAKLPSTAPAESTLAAALCKIQYLHIWGGVPKHELLLMEEIRHQLIDGLSHYLQGFIHPRWLFGISSINRKWFHQYSTTSPPTKARHHLGS